MCSQCIGYMPDVYRKTSGQTEWKIINHIYQGIFVCLCIALYRVESVVYRVYQINSDMHLAQFAI